MAIVRIAGVSLPNKRIVVALTYVYGVGPTRAKKIVEAIKINPDTRPNDLTTDEVSRLRDAVEKQYKVEGELRREVGSNIKRLKDINSYRGIRHMRRLPLRGQRTKTNSRTTRGNVRKTMGSGRRPAAGKT
jgi:small subunit ribosomal protein S13